MKIELAFDQLPPDLDAVRVDIHLEDASEADAPARRLRSWRIESLPLERERGTVIDTALQPAESGPELTLFVRVEGSTPRGEVRFINTTSVPVPSDDESSPDDHLLEVPLERIV
ncbi:MAG: hypothetical protein AAGC60_27545 [Acidobacteriota bacterium]